MSTQQDLIAARALIDTRKKFARGNLPSLFSRSGGRLTVEQALVAVTDGAPFATFPLGQILTDALSEGHDDLGAYLAIASHADVMALFDRAIAATQLKDQA